MKLADDMEKTNLGVYNLYGYFKSLISGLQSLSNSDVKKNALAKKEYCSLFWASQLLLAYNVHKCNKKLFGMY